MTVMERTPCARLSSNVYGFVEFVRDVEWRLQMLAETVSEPDFDWPGVLILDVAAGLSVTAFPIGATAAERERLVTELVVLIGEADARRFAWAMPCLRDEGGHYRECLLLVCAERGRVEAALAEVRPESRAPRLGPFRHGPFGSGARRISGRFVEPLVAALYY